MVRAVAISPTGPSEYRRSIMLGTSAAKESWSWITSGKNSGVARDAQAERPGRRHLLDVAAVATDDQRQLQRVPLAFGKVRVGDRQEERVGHLPLRLRFRLGLRLDHARHRHRGSLGLRNDAD